jgi:hypothetical protein
MDPARIAEIIAKLANEETAAQVSREDVVAALAAIQQRAQEYADSGDKPTADSVKALTTMVEQRKTLKAALAKLPAPMSDEDAAKAQAEALAELDGKHDPARDHVQPDEDAAPVPPPDKPADDDEDDTADKTKTTTDKTTDKPAGAPRNSGRSRQLGDLGDRPDKPEGATPLEVVGRTLVRGEVPGHVAGAQLATMQAFIKATQDLANALDGVAAPGRHDIARIEFTYPEERQLDGTNERANTEKIAKATSPEAITAAGGLCLPLETRTDIETIGVTDRPVKAALSGFQVNRGGIQYRGPFDALAMSEGLGVWSQADDAAVVVEPPAGPRKTCMIVDCPGLLEASIYSTYLCLEFANMTARFDQQWVTATTDSAQVAWARFAENQLLSRIAAGSKAVTGEHAVGAVRDLLWNYDRFIAYYRNRHRLNSTVPLHTMMPQWVINMLQSDLALAFSNASPAEVFAISQATLESWFRTRNVNVTWHLDGLAGGTQSTVVFDSQNYADLAAGGTVPEYPASVDSILYREGDWLFLDGGTLDLGLVRDSTLNLRNRYQTFMETFEGVAFTGKESLRLKLPLVPSGASTGTIDPRAIDPTLPVVTP